MKLLNRCMLVIVMALALSACNNYGDKVSKDFLEVYYKDGINKEQAEKTLNFLYPYWKSPGSEETNRKSVQLIKNGDTIYFRMVSVAEKVALMNDEIFYQMGNTFADSLFGGSPVNVDLTDNKFKTIRTFHYKKKLNSEEVSQ